MENNELKLNTNVDELLKKINERKDIRSIAFFQKRYNEIINLPWIFFMIILLLSVEWFLRKNNGGY